MLLWIFSISDYLSILICNLITYLADKGVVIGEFSIYLSVKVKHTVNISS
jgi:hypothetical protein